MTDSAFSNVVTATSPEQVFAPNPPVINSVTFDNLVASVALTMPTVNTNGGALTDLINIKVFFGPAGSDLSAAAPVDFPGTYPAGSAQTVVVDVPAYATTYDFETEVSN